MSRKDTPSGTPTRKTTRPQLKRPGKPRPPSLAAVVGTNHTGRERDFTVPPPEFTCEGCDTTRPAADFSKYLTVLGAKRAEMGGLEEPEVDRLCNHCATYGPPIENPLAPLSPAEIEALSVLAAGGSMRRAAAVMGVTERQIRSYLTGREKAVLRGAYQKLLLQMGITPERIAGVLLDALTAEKPLSLGSGEFRMFPDHSNRLKAAALAQKILQLEQPAELTGRAPEGNPGGGIHFHTNLGDGTVVDDGAYTIEVRPSPRQVN